MKELLVSIERGGERIPVGFIRGEGSADARFAYSDTWLRDPASAPISLSLPLQEAPFTPAQTKAYFDGLLPEGFTRSTVAQWMHVDDGDYLSILHGLGRECLGALCITEEGEDPQASYEKITREQVRELAVEGASKSAEIVTSTHLSLTGASGKVGLYFDAPTGDWYLPRGTAPSTHIVKQSHVRLDAIVTNERLSLLTAARCGIPVSGSFIVNTGGRAEHEVLFATARYDRFFPAAPKRISGLPSPQRLHQEDFAQALGIPASMKYEKEPRGYLREMFALLRRASGDPITDQLRLWDLLVFNWLLGNTDAHVKNFSLLYSPDLRRVRLASAYDLVSTAAYRQSTREMAFYIGGALLLDDVTEDAFRQAARDVGLGERMAMRRFDEMCRRFKPALHESAEELIAAGYNKAAELEARILQSGGIAKHG